MATLSSVEPREIPALWPAVLPFLENAIGRSSGRLSEATVLKDCLAGNYVLWLVVENGIIGALVTRIVVWPTGVREAVFVLAGGENHQAWMPLMTTVEKWALGNGCSLINVAGRPGWEREINKLPGWRKMAVEMEKNLAG